MRSTYKWIIWRATRPVNTADCTNEWRYFLSIQSAVFTRHVARQTNRLYVLHMIVKLAYTVL